MRTRGRKTPRLEPLFLRDIPGWPGYRISGDGAHIIGFSGRSLVQVPDYQGYLRVRLYFFDWESGGRRRKWVRVARLVAFTFIGPPPHPDWEVAHNDDVRDHNHHENLSWLPHHLNMAQRWAGWQRAKRKKRCVE